MDYEKKYNEALEIARQIHDGNPSSGTATVVCEQIFPELCESEDERIRKEIRDFLIDMECKEEWITHMEKQKEQKPSEWSEEDEAFLKVAIAVCNRYSHKDIADWLKSLRPQPKQDKGPIAKFVQAVEDVEQCRKGYEEGLRDGMKRHWKPSEEQMEALRVTIDFMPDTFKPRCTLITLQNGLEKLM